MLFCAATLVVLVGAVNALGLGLALSTDLNRYISIEPTEQVSNCLPDAGTTQKSCSIAHVLVNKDSVQYLNELLLHLRDTKSVHKIVLEVRNADTSATGRMVDGFLAVSPWWVMWKEKYTHHDVDDPVQGGEEPWKGKATIKKAAHAGGSRHSVILIAFKATFQSQLKLISGIQNPPTAELCEESSLMVARMINSGWGSQAAMFALRRKEHPFSIFEVWYSKHNWANESSSIVHADDCPEGTINKWDCLFLPRTNCSLDHAAFTHCKAVDETDESCFRGDFFHVAKLTEDGGKAMVPFGDGGLGDAPVNAFQKSLQSTVVQDVTSSPEIESKLFVNSAGEITQFRQFADTVLPEFGLMYRPNAFLRHSVRTRIAELREHGHLPFDGSEALQKVEAKEKHLRGGGNDDKGADAARVGGSGSGSGGGSGGGCIAVHIRRGDRVVAGVNMRDFCNVYLRNGSITRNTCDEEEIEKIYLENDKKFPQVDCGGLLDYGCFDRYSFGELTLVDYLVRAKRVAGLIAQHSSDGGPGGAVVPTKNAFVLTDDGAWLEEQLKALPTAGAESGVGDWTVGRLPSAPGSRIDAGDKGNGTAASIDMWTSIELARQCQGFVGHFSSSVAHFVYQAMCFHHDRHTGICPPAADIGAAVGAADDR